MDKYKIFIDRDTEAFSAVIKALVESGMFVFTRRRDKSLEQIRAHHGTLSAALDYGDWIIIGYSDQWTECKRTLYTVEDDWHALYEYKAISLEDFVKLKEREKANAGSTVISTQV